eukprot:TRINITY_DN24496_c0_g1_i1.p1 TRINITY_DN24496_c0_g1~~TRINITY_DN24496_c0_g1_i1.p1  ORF type:complete len:415 (+),score=68.43 TRINITY_DN24496_c0_g1_i1:273-1517(+)
MDLGRHHRPLHSSSEIHVQQSTQSLKLTTDNLPPPPYLPLHSSQEMLSTFACGLPFNPLLHASSEPVDGLDQSITCTTMYRELEDLYLSKATHPIPLEKVCEWLEYQKTYIVSLMHNTGARFTEGIDFIQKLARSPSNRKCVKYYLSMECFLELCKRRKTTKGRLVLQIFADVLRQHSPQELAAYDLSVHAGIDPIMSMWVAKGDCLELTDVQVLAPSKVRADPSKQLTSQDMFQLGLLLRAFNQQNKGSASEQVQRTGDGANSPLPALSLNNSRSDMAPPTPSSTEEEQEHPINSLSLSKSLEQVLFESEGGVASLSSSSNAFLSHPSTSNDPGMITLTFVPTLFSDSHPPPPLSSWSFSEETTWCGPSSESPLASQLFEEPLPASLDTALATIPLTFHIGPQEASIGIRTAT